MHSACSHEQTALQCSRLRFSRGASAFSLLSTPLPTWPTVSRRFSNGASAFTVCAAAMPRFLRTDFCVMTVAVAVHARMHSTYR